LSAFLRPTREGRNFLICSARSSTLEPAASAVIWNLSGCSSTMSRVWVPMEPVDPRRANFLGPLVPRGT